MSLKMKVKSRINKKRGASQDEGSTGGSEHPPLLWSPGYLPYCTPSVHRSVLKPEGTA